MIRPTALERHPESLAPDLAKDELALYTLIYNRLRSTQPWFTIPIVDIESGAALFRPTPGDEVRRLTRSISRARTRPPTMTTWRRCPR